MSLKESVEHLKKNWRVIRGVPFLSCLAVVALGIFFLIDWHYRGVLDAKEATIRTVAEERDKANRDNEKLSKQIEALRIYRGQDALPLKRKALILLQQIRAFIKDWKDTDEGDVRYGNIQNYLKRFGLRVTIIRDDLDQNGQQSDAFDKVMYHFSFDSYKDIQVIASEMERLANKLPD